MTDLGALGSLLLGAFPAPCWGRVRPLSQNGTRNAVPLLDAGPAKTEKRNLVRETLATDLVSGFNTVRE